MANDLIEGIQSPEPVWPDTPSLLTGLRIIWDDVTDILTIRFSDGPEIGIEFGPTGWLHIDPISGLVRALEFEDFEAVVLPQSVRLQQLWARWKQRWQEQQTDGQDLLREFVKAG